jgi:hypothetical protein
VGCDTVHDRYGVAASLGKLADASASRFRHLITPFPPIFYFALYRDEGSLQVSERLRLLARTAAFILGILLAFQFAPWIKSPTQPVPTLLGALATIANILLLAALSRDAGDEPEEARPVGTLLSS